MIDYVIRCILFAIADILAAIALGLPVQWGAAMDAAYGDAP